MENQLKSQWSNQSRKGKGNLRKDNKKEMIHNHCKSQRKDQIPTKDKVSKKVIRLAPLHRELALVEIKQMIHLKGNALKL